MIPTIITAAVAATAALIIQAIINRLRPPPRPPATLAPPQPAVHPGIRVRVFTVTTGDGDPLVLDETSDVLHYRAVFSELDDPCRPDCPPGCTRHGWHVLCPVELGRVEIRPVWLANDLADTSS